MKPGRFFKYKPELLAPAGSLESLQSALYFGADAVYFGGKNFSLRQSADNFDYDGLKNAVNLCRESGKAAFIACNIFAHNRDLKEVEEYIRFISDIKADGVIISDAGILSLAKKIAPLLPVHLSTQSNVTNKEAALFWAGQGVKRIVLSRELTLNEIREIRDALPDEVELEAFVHGAMCMSYSGRCLISDFLKNRRANGGECIQACRFEYEIREKSQNGEYMTLNEDGRGSYILNSKDLNLIRHLYKLYDAGIKSFKIEGRNKSAYYVANSVNAYRRAFDFLAACGEERDIPEELVSELYKSAHRKYFTGFYFKDEPSMDTEGQHYSSSQTEQEYKFMALVTNILDDGTVEIEQRNKFTADDEMEILSPKDSFNKVFKIGSMNDFAGNSVEIANIVQQKLYIKTSVKLHKGDILRQKVKNV